jgi:23S rRNA (uridine2552-2'-O)-methyltransferase
MPRKPPEKARRTGRKRRLGNKGFYSTFPSSPPVKEDQEVDVFTNDVGSNEDGIARMQNFPIFVPKTKAGERLKIRIIKVGVGFVVAERL